MRSPRGSEDVKRKGKETEEKERSTLDVRSQNKRKGCSKILYYFYNYFLVSLSGMLLKQRKCAPRSFELCQYVITWREKILPHCVKLLRIWTVFHPKLLKCYWKHQNWVVALWMCFRKMEDVFNGAILDWLMFYVSNRWPYFMLSKVENRKTSGNIRI